jgi:uncharacterized membrane protein (DUF2068 family)
VNNATNEHKAPFGLRTVAIFEWVKGFAWLVGGVVCLFLRHSDVQAKTEHLLHFLHVDPAWGFTKLCIDVAARANDRSLLLLAGLLVICSIIRFVEAYGLWHERHWAEWFAVLSAGLFLPVEIYHLFHRPTWFKGAVFVFNVLLVIYLARLLAAQHHRKKAEQIRQSAPQLIS